MKKMIVMAAVMGMMAALAATAQELRPLSGAEEGHYGATHALEVNFTHFSGTTTAAVAQTNTVTISGPCSWKIAGWVLEAPYCDLKQYATNGLPSTTNSITQTVSIDSTALVSAVQVARDQTRAYRSVMPASYTSGTLTNGQSSTITWITTAPGGGVPLSNMKFGRARLFLRIL